MILNLWLFLDYLFVNIQVALWFVGMPGSLLIYHLYFKSQKEKPNPQATKFTFIFPGIFWFFAMLFYVLALASPTNRYEDLVLPYTIQLVLSGFLFLYGKSPPGVQYRIKLTSIGGALLLLNAYLAFIFIKEVIHPKIPTDENLMRPSFQELGLVVYVVLVLMVGIFYTRSVNANRNTARYIFIFPTIFCLVGILIYAFFPGTDLTLLGAYIPIQVFPGWFLFFYMKENVPVPRYIATD